MSQPNRDNTVAADLRDASDRKPLGTLPPKPRPAKRGGRITTGVKSVVSGNILDSKRRYFPFIMYCCLLAAVYLWHLISYQSLQRRELNARHTTEQMRLRAIAYRAIRMNSERFSSLTERVEQMGIDIEESVEPPKVIRKSSDKRK